ncbi:site-specific integrase [Verrucosispora sp. WMMD1129]|uniref:tyrosine-type recombinase/integrase n=1 Tax=Verrucosispora sp. WMMD1129 TaxID=3016093 RepID=UPI00249CA71B|nr:site-specific integrase [Verrucosispora sp. WMMD1129]WFE47567.1 tyrosine-type recombinase/integrase [Verrucosispora sp. WMMD1129]
MATIEKRTTKDGKNARWRVKWRDGGRRDGEWDGETFDYQADAKRFKALVDANGNHRPSPEQLVEHGFGHLAPAPPAAPVDEPPAMTFRQYALAWLDTLTKPSAETKRKYLERLEKHVFPTLGDLPIAGITRRMLREWQTGLLAAGLSRKTIANIRGESVFPIFRASCLPGEDEEPPLRTYNPMEGLALPDGPKFERDFLETPEQASILLTAAYEVDPEAADLLLTKLASGLRWGEVAALPPEAVRKHLGTIEIRQVLRKVERRWVVEPKPKTKNGYRQVPLHPLVMHVVNHRAEKAGDFVFYAPRGNHWRYEDFYDWRWVKIRMLAESRGLRGHMTMHGLRHSLLTLLATEGLELSALKGVAGHAQVATTMDVYVHHTTAHHEPVRRIVGGFLEAGIRAGEQQRATSAGRTAEIRGRVHRSPKGQAARPATAPRQGR